MQKEFADNLSFASEYKRTPEGWILFPSDVAYRKVMFPIAVSEHIAKANVYLIQSIVEYVSKPGDYLLDPMSGSGTLMVAALWSRDVMLIEISPKYHEWQQQALTYLDSIAPGVSGHVFLINSPLQTILPMPSLADHIIFSPPYASIMKTKGKDKLTRETMGDIAGEYTFSHPLNLGTMNDWLWTQEMTKVYDKCYKTLKPGGTMTLITKDHMLKRERVQLSQGAYDACIRVGFQPKDWFKWKAPGSVYTSIYRSRGWEVVEDEDIIIVQKPALEPIMRELCIEYSETLSNVLHQVQLVPA
jgi:DNA modification methylase